MKKENMNYEEFKNELKQDLQKELSEITGKDIQIKEHEAHKSNETLEAMVITHESLQMSPTIYPSRLFDDYQNGQPYAEIKNGVRVTLSNALIQNHELPDLNKEFVMNNVELALFNKEKNEELMKTCPYKDIEGTDLIAIPKVRLHLSDGEASSTITNNIMTSFRMTKEEMLAQAQLNTNKIQFEMRPMNEVIADMFREEGMDEDFIEMMTGAEVQGPSIHVISNSNKFEGASVLACPEQLSKLTEELDSSVYILPSSRHEVLFLKENEVDNPEELKKMVEEVNEQEVSVEDYLSNRTFHYDKDSHKLSMCDDNGLFKDNSKKLDMSESLGKGKSGR